MSLDANRRAWLDTEFGSSLAGDISIGVPLSHAEIDAFQQAIGAILPEQYARFLREIGDGCLGPGLTYRRLAEACQPGLRPDLPLELPGAIVDDSSNPYPPEFAVVDRVEDIWSGQGVIELADYGCSMRVLLVVTGSRAGEVWFHEPSIVAFTPWWYWSILHGPIDDLHFGHGHLSERRYDFLDWYEEWLDRLLSARH